MRLDAYGDAGARAIALLTEEKYEHLETVRDLLAATEIDSRVDAVREDDQGLANGSQQSPDEGAGLLVAQNRRITTENPPGLGS